jgi:hypothetical protein
VPHFGHIASISLKTSRKIRGCDAHSGIDGLGQYAGRSLAKRTTTYAPAGIMVAFFIFQDN